MASPRGHLEGTVLNRGDQALTRSAHWWRVAGGVAVLLALIAVAVALAPPYLENMQFQRYLDRTIERSQNPGILVAEIVDHAGRLGLPVRAGDVHVTRSTNGLRVEIIYVVHVDLPLYTVDLHFHPAAGG